MEVEEVAVNTDATSFLFQKGKFMEKSENRMIFLTVGKEVKMFFNQNNNLKKIRLSLNKVAELFGNGIVDEETIFEVNKISLVTKTNYKTVIRVVNGTQKMIGNAKIEKVGVDQDKTKSQEGNFKIKQQGFFDFFVAEGETVPKFKLLLPYNPHQRKKKK